MSKLAIISGVSRGYGAALAKHLLAANWTVIGFARAAEAPKELSNSSNFIYERLDLSDANGGALAAGFCDRILAKVRNEGAASSVTLVHNAGLLVNSPLGTADEDESTQTTRATLVNLNAPLILTSQFVKHVQDWDCEKRVICISSGAATSPYPSWGNYCATKAGLEMMVRVLRAEQADKAHPVHALSVAPGIIGTDMQKQIRETPDEKMAMKSFFVKLHDEGDLWSPEYATELLVKHVLNKSPLNFSEKDRVDIRELMDDTEGGAPSQKKAKS